MAGPSPRRPARGCAAPSAASMRYSAMPEPSVPTDFVTSSRKRSPCARGAPLSPASMRSRVWLLGHALPQRPHIGVLRVARKPVGHRVDEAAPVDDAVVHLAVQRHAAVGQAIDGIELPQQAAASSGISCSSQTLASRSSIDALPGSVSRWTCAATSASANGSTLAPATARASARS